MRSSASMSFDRTASCSRKRKGLTYAQLAERLSAMGVQETERNLNNKISRGGFTAAFLLQCLEAIDATEIRLR